MEVVADRLTVLLKTVELDALDKRVVLEALSDLRAAYCSFCNKSLHRDSAGKLDATEDSSDEYKNRRWKCNLCSSARTK